MTQVARRKAVAVTLELRCRDEAVELTLRHGAPQSGFRPIGKDWRTLRRGDTVRGPEGYEYTVKRLTLDEAEPPLDRPFEIESVAAWTSTGLRR